MRVKLIAAAVLLILTSATTALGQTFTLDLLNTTDDTLIRLTVGGGGEVHDFTPLASGERGVFRIEPDSGSCQIFLRGRFKRGASISTRANFCTYDEGMAFSGSGTHWQIVPRRQLGL